MRANRDRRRIGAVHQFVPTLEPGAVGAHALHLQRLFRDRGLRSEVFAEHLRWRNGAGLPFTEYGRSVAARPGDVLVYHLAIGSVVADFVARQRGRLVVNHHNVTPVEHFLGWQPDAIHGLAWGVDQLARLATRAELGVADSGFNEAELRATGYRRTAVAPILVDTAALLHEVDEAALSRLVDAKSHGGTEWLFVGRLAPNKCQHDLLKAFAAYATAYDPAARLRLVGAPSSDRYRSALADCAIVLGLRHRVTLTGAVSAGELAAHYRAADVYVCLSEHEGFLVPLLEAWAHQLPVVAFRAAAVPETLGTAGMLLDDKTPLRVAAAVHRVMTDPVVRGRLVAAGDARLATFSLEHNRGRFLTALERGLGAEVGRG